MMTTIFYWRRKVQSDDTVVINDTSAVTNILMWWRQDWEPTGLTPAQKTKCGSAKASIWRAYLRNHYGGLYFVCGMLQTGMRHAPFMSPSNTSNVAAERVTEAWTRWLVDLSKAIKQQARRSGRQKVQSGFTRDEYAARQEYKEASARFYVAKNFAWRYSQIERQQGRAAAHAFLNDKQHKQLLTKYWNRSLQAEYYAAKAKCGQGPKKKLFGMWR